MTERKHSSYLSAIIAPEVLRPHDSCGSPGLNGELGRRSRNRAIAALETPVRTEPVGDLSDAVLLQQPWDVTDVGRQHWDAHRQ